jgi:hypothetical protein
MTEAEWLACTDPRPMLYFLRGKASDRKVRLLAVACCRRVWPTFTDERSRTAIDVAERFADGNAIFSELDRACTDAGVAASEADWDDSREAAWATGFGLLLDNLTPIVEFGIVRVLESTALVKCQVDGIGMRDELEQQSTLARDIFDNPFHPLPPRPKAITPLAERIYAGEWNLMPLLGEWLQEHGYWSQGEHCLDPKLHHVKGCWVVDWVTGRE